MPIRSSKRQLSKDTKINIHILTDQESIIKWSEVKLNKKQKSLVKVEKSNNRVI